MRFVLIMITAVVLVTTAACGSGTPGGRSSTTLPQGGEPVQLDPALFTSEITNPYWPMTPGNRWVYRGVRRAGARETGRGRRARPYRRRSWGSRRRSYTT